MGTGAPSPGEGSVAGQPRISLLVLNSRMSPGADRPPRPEQRGRVPGRAFVTPPAVRQAQAWCWAGRDKGSRVQGQTGGRWPEWGPGHTNYATFSWAEGKDKAAAHVQPGGSDAWHTPAPHPQSDQCLLKNPVSQKHPKTQPAGCTGVRGPSTGRAGAQEPSPA